MAEVGEGVRRDISTFTPPLLSVLNGKRLMEALAHCPALPVAIRFRLSVQASGAPP